MPIRLPFENLVVPVRQLRARVSGSTLKPSAADWAGLPHGDALRGLYARKVRKEGDCCQLRVGPGAATLLIAVCPVAEATTFERLQSAAKIARAALDSEPETLLIWERGCDPTTVEPALHATLAAIQAAAFRFASFKSKPKPRTSLARIDLALARTLRDLEATLATSAGNNIARWLTALPPNTLNAGAYRRLLQDFARRFKLSYRFYGEPELKRLGAGAFLAVSQGNGTRDAGIVRVLSFDAESFDDITPEAEHPSLVAQQREYEQPFGDDLIDALRIQS